MKKNKIDKKITIGELIEKHPKAARILAEKYGFHCIGCGMAGMETVEEGLKAHGYNGKKMEEVLEKLGKEETKK